MPTYKICAQEKSALKKLHKRFAAQTIPDFEKLHSKLNRIRSKTEITQSRIMYAELTAIYDYYVNTYTRDEAKQEKQLFELAEQHNISYTKASHPISLMFRIFCNMEKKIAHKRANTLRYVLCMETKPIDAETFLKEKGVTFCSDRFSTKHGIKKATSRPKINFAKNLNRLNTLLSTASPKKPIQIKIYAQVDGKKITFTKIATIKQST